MQSLSFYKHEVGKIDLVSVCKDFLVGNSVKATPFKSSLCIILELIWFILWYLNLYIAEPDNQQFANVPQNRQYLQVNIATYLNILKGNINSQ